MAPHEMVARYMAPKPAEGPAIGQPSLAEKQGEVRYAVPQLANLARRERERMPSWYASGNDSERSLASDTELGHLQGATLGCVGSSGESESESPLSSAEAESTPRSDEGKMELAASDDLRDAVSRLGTSARVTGGAGEKRRVHFAPIPRIIPDAWFQLQSEGARFPS